LPDELAPWLDRLPEQDMHKEYGLMVTEITWFRANARAIALGERQV